ncbi:MAG: hypothetical protein M1833_005206 [Piccolia ochrophora]|nr:MAG: hypothetical protein M1833_005206 [Piccolia ochrophora]
MKELQVRRMHRGAESRAAMALEQAPLRMKMKSKILSERKTPKSNHLASITPVHFPDSLDDGLHAHNISDHRARSPDRLLPLSHSYTVPLELLVNHSNVRALGDLPLQRSITVPESIIPHLLTSPNESVWDIAAECDCQIAIESIDKSCDDRRPVWIQGLKSDVDRVGSHLDSMTSRLLVDHRIEVGPKLGYDSRLQGSLSPVNRETVSILRFPRYRSDKWRRLLPDEVPRPTKWTKATVTDYVRQLCLLDMPRSVQHTRNQGSEGQHPRVARMLLELFEDDAIRPYITTQALNDALNLLLKCHKIKQAREIFSLTDLHGPEKNTGTFNAFLRGAANEANLHAYTTMLRMMVQRGLRPDGRTWLYFLMMVQEKDVRTSVLQQMQRKGLLQYTEILQRGIAPALPDDLRDWLSTGQTPIAFLEHMYAVHGPDWLSVEGVGRILNVLGQRGLLHDCLQVWEACCQRKIELNTICLNTILAYHLQWKGKESVVEVLELAYKHRIRPNESTYEYLLDLSWERHLHNLARVIWRYACMDGAVPFNMQRKVVRSLAKFSASEPRTRQYAFSVVIGRLVVGVGTSEEDTGEAIANESDSKSSNAIRVGMEDCFETEIGRERCQQIVDEDLAAFAKWRPLYPLHQLVKLALAKDTEWAEKGVWQSQLHSWQVQNAIPVPLERFVKRSSPKGRRAARGKAAAKTELLGESSIRRALSTEAPNQERASGVKDLESIITTT